MKLTVIRVESDERNVVNRNTRNQNNEEGTVRERIDVTPFLLLNKKMPEVYTLINKLSKMENASIQLTLNVDLNK